MCTVASAPAAFRVRVRQIMSRGRGLGARRSPPEGASVGYSLTTAQLMAALSVMVMVVWVLVFRRE